jgi:hypothetical protein
VLPVEEVPLAAAVAVLPDAPVAPDTLPPTPLFPLALPCVAELCCGTLTPDEPATTLAVVTAVGNGACVEGTNVLGAGGVTVVGAGGKAAFPSIVHPLTKAGQAIVPTTGV